MREDWQKIEDLYLAPYAAHSNASRGRLHPEPECPIRTVWQRDRDRIIHSKAFRRLKHKTQVFINPEGDHVRTRLTHTLEVAQISRTVARALRLNEDLTEAIALGHDLGHTPFGHIGERALRDIDGCFQHGAQSLRQVDLLEKNGKGLNLTHEVRDGILHHSGPELPFTLEGMVIRICDRIAYLNHDLDDASRSGFLAAEMLPDPVRQTLGDRHGERINHMVLDLIRSSEGQAKVTLSPEMTHVMDEFRSFMFRNVYFRKDMREQEEKLKELIYGLYDYYLRHFDELPEEFRRSPAQQAVIDYIAGMTDGFALEKAKELL